LAQLEELQDQVLKEEAEVREREAQELRLAEGSFPALSGGVGAAGVSTYTPLLNTEYTKF